MLVDVYHTLHVCDRREGSKLGIYAALVSGFLALATLRVVIFMGAMMRYVCA